LLLLLLLLLSLVSSNTVTSQRNVNLTLASSNVTTSLFLLDKLIISLSFLFAVFTNVDSSLIITWRLVCSSSLFIRRKNKQSKNWQLHSCQTITLAFSIMIMTCVGRYLKAVMKFRKWPWVHLLNCWAHALEYFGYYTNPTNTV